MAQRPIDERRLFNGDFVRKAGAAGQSCRDASLTRAPEETHGIHLIFSRIHLLLTSHFHFSRSAFGASHLSPLTAPHSRSAGLLLRLRFLLGWRRRLLGLFRRRTRGRLTWLNFLVEQFVLVILDLVLEFDPGDANEGFASCQNVAETEPFVTSQNFATNPKQVGVFGLPIGYFAVKQNDLARQFGAFSFLYIGDIGSLRVALLPFFERVLKLGDLRVLICDFGFEIGNCLIGRVLVGSALFGQSLNLFGQRLFLRSALGLGGLQSRALGFSRPQL